MFEATPEKTREVAERCRTEGYKVVKFGWGPLGLDSLETDVALVAAAREGLGPDIALCVDAGTIYKRDSAAALQRAHAFAPYVAARFASLWNKSESTHGWTECAR